MYTLTKHSIFWAILTSNGYIWQGTKNWFLKTQPSGFYCIFVFYWIWVFFGWTQVL